MFRVRNEARNLEVVHEPMDDRLTYARYPFTDGSGSITFDGVDRWVKLQVSDKPGKELALGGVLLAITGLLGSLFIRPRRAWVRVRSEGGRTLVELAGLDRSAGGDLAEEIDELEHQIRHHDTPQKEKP